MTRRHNRNAGVHEGCKERQKRLGVGFVEMRHGFVGENDDRTVDDGTGKKRELLLTGRKSSGQSGSKFANTAFFKRE